MSLQETNNIEVELQFPGSQSSIENISSIANVLKDRQLDETIFDTKDFQLFTSDQALRLRNGRFELKFRKSADKGTQLEIYSETDEENEIKSHLNIVSDKPLSLELLSQSGYLPHIHIITRRRTFELEGCTIDIDETDFGYSVIEIELIVHDRNQIEIAKERIVNLAKKLNLSTEPARNKVKEYIIRFLPEVGEILKKKMIISH